MSARETARPMPDPAPVTTAITPATLLSLDPPIIVDASAPWAPPGSIGRASSGWTLWSEADRHPAVIHGGEAPRESVDAGLEAVGLDDPPLHVGQRGERLPALQAL